MSDKLEKITKLLAQAESASTREEAESYTKMAQHIASANAISLELAYARQEQKTKREEPATKRVQVGEYGRQHKNRFWVDLALEIARANDIRCTISHDRSSIWAYGFPSDIEVLELLFGSLAVQMVQQADASLKRGDHKARGVHGATWRMNFYEGFIRGVSSKLWEARSAAMEEQKKRDAEIMERLSAVLPREEQLLAAANVPAPGEQVTGAMVMVKKKEAVDDYYTTKTKGTLSRGSYSSYGASRKHSGAQSAGRAAGYSASLGGRGAVGGNKKAIG